MPKQQKLDAPVAKKRIIGYTITSSFIDSVREMIQHPDGLNAIAVIIDQDGEEDLKPILDMCDAVVLSGGADWMPTTFGNELETGNGFSKFDKARDIRELFIMEYFEQKDKKILGICRGHQGLALKRGVPFYSNIHGCDVIHNPGAYEIKTDGQPIHFIQCEPAFQGEFFDLELVNSWHHQAVDFKPNANYEDNYGIQVIGTAKINNARQAKNNVVIPEERIIEIMRDVEGKFVSCQFHLELDWQNNPASESVLNAFKKMLGGYELEG